MLYVINCNVMDRLISVVNMLKIKAVRFKAAEAVTRPSYLLAVYGKVAILANFVTMA